MQLCWKSCQRQSTLALICFGDIDAGERFRKWFVVASTVILAHSDEVCAASCGRFVLRQCVCCRRTFDLFRYVGIV